jgi:hypothetical protein
MFARAPFVRRNPGPPVVIGELLERASGRSAASVTTVYYRPQREPFHIGLPVKLANAKSGTANGSGRDVIEHAATQVITCLNGFADFIHRDLDVLNTGPVFIVPVIFTTATLYGSDTDVSTATLADGCLSSEAIVERLTWLWFQYHVSTSLRHQVPRSHFGDRSTLGDILEQEHARSIAIVNPTGIEDFVQAGNASHLFETMR